jgi:hypothetical protein
MSDEQKPKIENLAEAERELAPEELTSEEAEGAQGGLANSSIHVNTLTFSSNATGTG